MNCRSLARLAWSALVMTSLSACSSTPSIGQMPSLPSTPDACLRICPPMPRPTGPSEAELLRWEFQMVPWGEQCALIPLECSAEIRRRL